ncbi:MAG: prepilin-type N-terminal cleavage/methylation domain-containing protein [Clostridia bacterium]|nr:prepilin-type N-terminal cleavage/methylation domain-containing protein [Clostridia bacterium]
MKRTSKKGFTLMEMLIVIAIIAILIAIAIPVFTAQLNKARKGTDQSNARSLKSMVVTAYLTGDGVKIQENGVYYLNKQANGILTEAGDNCLKCEGSGDGYNDSTKGNDAGYIWALWKDTAVSATNPSLEGADS